MANAYVTLADFKAYGRIESTAEDALAQVLIDAAVEFCAEYAGQDFATTAPTGKMKVAIMGIALHWLVNRQAGSEINIAEVPWAARAILEQERGIVTG